MKLLFLISFLITVIFLLISQPIKNLISKQTPIKAFGETKSINHVASKYKLNKHLTTLTKPKPSHTLVPIIHTSPTKFHPSPTLRVPIKISRIDSLCVSSHLNRLTQIDIEKQTVLMKNAGIKWVRFDITWFDIEQAKNVYNWTKYDKIVDTINSKRMKVLALMTQYEVPEWERVDPSNRMSPPANPVNWGKFIKAFAQHFKNKISLYEIGNEPNLALFWPPVPNAQAYTKLLIEGYNAVKSADPGNKVISAGLAPDHENNGLTFARNMYNNGAKGHFDYFGLHPYSYPRSPEITTYGQGLGRISAVKTFLLDNGDPEMQIIASEFGWPTTSIVGGVNESTQADYINLFYQNILFNNYKYVPIACLYDFINDGTDPSNLEANFGIIRNDYTLKASYYTFQQLRILTSASFTEINP